MYRPLLSSTNKNEKREVINKKKATFYDNYVVDDTFEIIKDKQKIKRFQILSLNREIKYVTFILCHCSCICYPKKIEQKIISNYILDKIFITKLSEK